VEDENLLFTITSFYLKTESFRAVLQNPRAAADLKWSTQVANCCNLCKKMT